MREHVLTPQIRGREFAGAPIGLAGLSGLLLVVSFPAFDLGPLAWVALVPLLLAIRNCAPGRAFGLGYFSGFVAFFGIVSWVRVFSFPAWVLLAAYLALYVGLFAALYRWLTADRAPAVSIWLVPVIWTSLEFVRSIGVFGFPWGLLGATQHAYPSVIQIARLSGVFGVSFVVALANAVAAASISSRRRTSVIVPALVVVAVVGWGVGEARVRPSGALTVSAIQPNVSPRTKFDPLYVDQNMRVLRQLVRDVGHTGAELIVFPETALPLNLFGAGGVLTEVGQWAHQARATLVASSLENMVSNIAVTVAPSGQAVSRYDKVRLVPFAEAGIRPGTRHDPLWTPVGRLGVAICFESIFPEVARELTRNGAEILAVITNDGYFDGTGGAAQHAAHAPLRAVETGRWVIHAANTGITMLIDPTGGVQAMVPARQEAAIVGRVALSRSLTFYARWGDLFASGVLIALALLAAPRLGPLLAGEWRAKGFQEAVATVLLPLIGVWALVKAGAGTWLWAGVLLGFVLVFSLMRAASGWGVHTSRVFETAAAGLAIVVGLWALLVIAYRTYGIPTGLVRPDEGWIPAVFRQVAVAVAVEGWLRGIAFASLSEWKGWPWAVAVTTAVGTALQAGLPPEAFAWALLTGAAFGLIRARTGNAVGLVFPHAVGNLLMALVANVR